MIFSRENNFFFLKRSFIQKPFYYKKLIVLLLLFFIFHIIRGEYHEKRIRPKNNYFSLRTYTITLTKVKKWLFISRSIGTTLSKEDTLNKATYPTAGDNVLRSNAKVIWLSLVPLFYVLLKNIRPPMDNTDMRFQILEILVKSLSMIPKILYCFPRISLFLYYR